MTVRRRKDAALKRVFVNKVADIRGGVSVSVSELGGGLLEEGTVLGAPVDGICKVVKVARVLTKVEEAGTAIEVAKGHHFKVGDFVMAAEGAKAYAITKIDTSASDKDTVTIETAIGVVEKGAFIVEAKGQSADSSSALKVEPVAINGTAYPVVPGDNIHTDAWVFAVVKGADIPDFIAEKMKGIVNL